MPVMETVTIINKSGKVVSTVRLSLLHPEPLDSTEHQLTFPRANISSTSSKKQKKPTMRRKPPYKPNTTPA